MLNIWQYEFMRHALIAGSMIATISAVMSAFVVMRKTIFATHALGHMSITGAALALIIGIPTVTGQVVLNILTAIIMGVSGDKVQKNDLVVGVVLTFILGIGAYCLFLFQNNYAGGVMNILFGNILTVSSSQIHILLLLSVIILLVLAFISRPLLFASIDPVVARQNSPVKLLSVIFFILLALAVSMACQIVGALLIFALLVIPGAIGTQWADDIYKILLVSLVSANAAVILALLISFYCNVPVSFCITVILSLTYVIGVIRNKTI